MPFRMDMCAHVFCPAHASIDEMHHLKQANRRVLGALVHAWEHVENWNYALCEPVSKRTRARPRCVTGMIKEAAARTERTAFQQSARQGVCNDLTRARALLRISPTLLFSPLKYA